MTPRSIFVTASVTASIVMGAASCRPSDVLNVPPPIGILPSASNQSGAETELTGATGRLTSATASDFFTYTGLLSDELTYGEFFENADPHKFSADARTGVWGYLAPTGPTSFQLDAILNARTALLLARSDLQQYEPASGIANVGRAYVLAGYTELLLAESFCAGVPLSDVLPGGGVRFGVPLTADSLLGTAEAHFDSALKYAGGNDTTAMAASVWLGRVRVDRGDFTGAVQAVTTVPIGFVYGMLSAASGSSGASVNIYANVTANGGCSEFNTADREGGNGMNFVSAHDARLGLDSTSYQTCDQARWYYPVKFGNPSTLIPIATGVEARLIAAEAALNGGDVNTAVADLDALRDSAPSTYVQLASPMPAMMTDPTGVDSLHPTPDQAVDILFRERAFWLFGTGTRIGDMRRLIRQYGRDASTVFPTGSYVGGTSPQVTPSLPSYGTDVSFMIPTPSSGWTPNPYYQGCLTSPSTA